MKKIKILTSTLSVALLLVQQLCLCVLLCGMLHGHHTEDAQAALALQTPSEMNLAGVHQNDCDESEHLAKCEKTNLNLVANTVDYVPAVTILSDDFSIPISIFRTPTYLAKQNTDSDGKIFLMLHNLRC